MLQELEVLLPVIGRSVKMLATAHLFYLKLILCSFNLSNKLSRNNIVSPQTPTKKPTETKKSTTQPNIRHTTIGSTVTTTAKKVIIKAYKINDYN